MYIDLENELGQIVSRETISKISKYLELLTKWNAAHNLYSRKLNANEMLKHIQDSIGLGLALPEGAHIVDIGSGNGLPGIILAAMGFKVTLIELRQKRCVFLSEVARIAAMNNVEVICIDARNYIPEHKIVITSKAVASVEMLLSLTSEYRDSIESYYLQKNSSQVESELAFDSANYEFKVIENSLLSDNVIIKVSKSQKS